MSLIRQLVFVLFLIVSSFIKVFSQNKLKIIFEVKNENSLNVDLCKFYISCNKIKKNNVVLFQEKDTAHLINPLDKQKNFIEIYLAKNSLPDEIVFGIGIDSAINYNGIKGGDLDPINGMYWSWNTGYINFKIETKNSLGCGNEKKEYHVGGFLLPYYTYREINLRNLNSQKADVKIILDLDKFLNGAVLIENQSVMSPGPSAVKLSDLFSSCFRLQ
jgi:hypothetical protein